MRQASYGAHLRQVNGTCVFWRAPILIQGPLPEIEEACESPPETTAIEGSTSQPTLASNNSNAAQIWTANRLSIAPRPRISLDERDHSQSRSLLPERDPGNISQRGWHHFGWQTISSDEGAESPHLFDAGRAGQTMQPFKTYKRKPRLWNALDLQFPLFGWFPTNDQAPGIFPV